MPASQTALLEQLRLQVARIERNGPACPPAVLGFGLPAIDQHLPGGGLARGALHEVAGTGPETEHGAAPALFVAGLAAALHGPVLWVLQRPDLFAPALAGAGLHPDRVIYAEAGKAVLLVMEEGLQHSGLAAVVGEVSGRLTLTASRRLQLAAEKSGVTAFALRRTISFSGAELSEPAASVTRWRITSLPSPPPLPHSPLTAGLSRARWRLDLVRCRGGEPSSWIVEAPDAKGRLSLVADAADRPAAAAHRFKPARGSARYGIS
ncbi:MAG: damage-inducible mutagenesis protein [Acetobacteraceae bacterium]|nr:damage-inducible mutagenesis protein [Acetobacteraceae bacterium]MBV8588745.1 damage-inducible mutagenesis protein [Acetobacteraceae bacterium]